MSFGTRHIQPAKPGADGIEPLQARGFSVIKEPHFIMGLVRLLQHIAVVMVIVCCWKAFNNSVLQGWEDTPNM